MSTTPSLTHHPESRSCPPNLPLKPVPAPRTAPLSTLNRDPDNIKLSKLGSRATIFWIRERTIVFELVVKEVADGSNRQYGGTLNG